MKALRKRVLLKSPVREFRTPGSVRGLLGNRQSYRDKRGLVFDGKVQESMFISVYLWQKTVFKQSLTLSLPQMKNTFGEGWGICSSFVFFRGTNIGSVIVRGSAFCP